MPMHLRPQLPFERQYETSERALAFRAETPEEWKEWKAQARAKLVELLGVPTERTPLEPELLETEPREGYRLEKWLLQTQPHVSMPTYVLVPEGRSGPAPVILASHGHGFGVSDIVGELRMHPERQAEFIPKLNYDYARQAARRGYVVIAPEQHGFGERREPELIAEDPGNSSCRQAGLWAALLGKTVLGVRVWDAMRCLDYMETRSEADMSRVGMIGLSGGGMVTLYTSALEDRLKASVVSGYFCQFRRSILAMFHCDCNYVPGLLKWFECADLAGMVAPKPVLFEAGTEDPIFPLAGVREAYEVAERVYRLLGIEDRLELDVFPGEHQWHGERAWEFLRKWV